MNDTENAVDSTTTSVPDVTTGGMTGDPFTKFSSESTQSFVKEAIISVIGGDEYNTNNVTKWTSSLTEKCLSYLMNSFKGYKFAFTCIFAEKTGGLNTSSTCYWDDKEDESCLIRWENKKMVVIVQVFAIRL